MSIWIPKLHDQTIGIIVCFVIAHKMSELFKNKHLAFSLNTNSNTTRLMSLKFVRNFEVYGDGMQLDLVFVARSLIKSLTEIYCRPERSCTLFKAELDIQCLWFIQNTWIISFIYRYLVRKWVCLRCSYLPMPKVHIYFFLF